MSDVLEASPTLANITQMQEASDHFRDLLLKITLTSGQYVNLCCFLCNEPLSVAQCQQTADLTTLSPTQKKCMIVNDGLERMWKEAIVTYFKLHQGEAGKNHGNAHDNLWPGRDSNPGPPSYNVRVLENAHLQC
jgi:hypothetical protein